MIQKLRVTSAEEEHELLLQTELRAAQVTMVGFSTSGLLLFELDWHPDSNVRVKKHVPLESFPFETLIAYYQLSRWPIASIKAGLQGIKAVVEHTDIERRQFYQNEMLLFSVKHHASYSTMTHHRDGYQINIETLERKRLDVPSLEEI